MATGRAEQEAIFYSTMEKKLENLPIVFTEYYNHLKRQKKSYSTMNVYFSNIFHFFNYIYGDDISENFVEAITLSNINAYMTFSETKQTKSGTVKMSESILQVRYSALNNFFEWLKQNAYIDQNPIGNIKRASTKKDKEISYLTPEEVQKIHEIIFDSIEDSIIAKRDLAIFTLAVTTGLKPNELCNINVEDVLLEGKCLLIKEKDNVRSVSLTKTTMKVLKEWLEARAEKYGDINTEALFVSQIKQRLSVDALNNMLFKYSQGASIEKKITMNTLRATAICYLLKRNVHVDDVAEYFGITTREDLIAYYQALDHKDIDVSLILENLLFDDGEENTNDEDFYINTNLENSTIPIEEEKEENAEDESDGFILYTDGNEKFIEYGRRYIDRHEYENDTDIKKVVLPNTINKIGEQAFCGCRSLQECVLPNQLTTIGDYAFAGCALKNIILPSELSSIGAGAFSGCGITHLYIPMNVSHIGSDTFSGCNLEKIEVDNQNTIFHSENNCLIQTKERKLIYACKNTIIPSDGTVEIIGDGAFIDWDCEDLVIPTTITRIESFAFSYSIKRIFIPHTVSEIHKWAFFHCSNLIIKYDGTFNEWKILFSDYIEFEREAEENNIQVLFSPSKSKLKIGDEVIFWNSVRGSVAEISEDFQKIKVCISILNLERDFNANDISLLWSTIGPITYPNLYISHHEDGTACEISNIEVLRNGSQMQIVFLAKKTYDEDGDNSKTEIGFRYKLKDSSGVIVCNSTWREYGLCVGETIRRSITFSNITSPGYVLEFNDYD